MRLPIKKCPKCKQIKNRSVDFGLRVNKRWARSYCLACEAAQGKNYLSTHPEVGRKNNRKVTLRRSAGITLEGYEIIFAIQKGLCAICQKPETQKDNLGRTKNLSVDHCHRTKQVRGLLCNNCNKGLGHLQDSQEILLNAAKYLESAGKTLPKIARDVRCYTYKDEGRSR